MKPIFCLSFCLCLLSQAQAYNPPKGIPDPGLYWGVLHPIDTPNPTRTVIAPGWFEGTPRVNSIAAGDVHDCYYIDKFHASSTDTANTFGKPTLPRKTIPNIVYSAGSYIEIHGDGSTTNGYGALVAPAGVGTDTSPIWFVGINNPVLSTNKTDICNANRPRISYMIWDGISWLHGGKPAIRPRFTNNVVDHICFRNSKMKGDGLTDGGGVGIGATALEDPTRTTQDIVIYNCEIADFGNKNAPAEEVAVYPSLYITRFWVLDSDVHDVAEDGFAGSHGGERTTSWYFIGRNRIHSNLTNAIDLKGCRDIVISENLIYDHHDIYSTNGVHLSSGIGQAVTFHYGGLSSGPRSWLSSPDNVTFCFNDVWSSQFAIRTSPCGVLRIVGNKIYDIHHETNNLTSTPNAFELAIRDDTWIVGNTFYGCDGGIKITNDPSNFDPVFVYYRGYSAYFGGTNYVCINDNNDAGMTGVSPPDTNYWKSIRIQIWGNIIANRTLSTLADVEFQGLNFPTYSLDMDYNIFHNAAFGEGIFYGSTTKRNLAWLQSNTPHGDHSLNTDPQFVDTSVTNLMLQSTSPAISAATEGTGYQSFLAQWGLDIKFDRALVSRPNGAGWDMGAYEFGTNAPVTNGLLSVVSISPSSGVAIVVSPNDVNSAGNGTTSFTRTYATNEVVTLTAPLTVAVTNIFDKWQLNGIDHATTLGTTVTMSANHTVTAIYTNAPAAPADFTHYRTRKSPISSARRR